MGQTPGAVPEHAGSVNVWAIIIWLVIQRRADGLATIIVTGAQVSFISSYWGSSCGRH